MMDVQTRRLGDLEIDDEFKLCRLLDRNIARFRPVQNLVDEFGGRKMTLRVIFDVSSACRSLPQLS